MLREEIDALIPARQGAAFWMVSGFVGILCVLSWISVLAVKFLNIKIFHMDALALQGQWTFEGMRLVLLVFLGYSLWKLPKHYGKGNGTSEKAVSVTAKQQAAKAERWFDPLMGLRAFACLLVVMGHYFLVVFPFQDGTAGRGVSALLRSSPWAGVWVFFTLSGYLMGKGFSHRRYSLDEAGMWNFLRNRFLRIGPIYYAAILVLGVFCYPRLFAHENWPALFGMCTFDFRGDLPVEVLNALWSISTEMQFYVLAPALMLFLLRGRRALGKMFFLLPLVLLALGTGMKMWLARHVYNMGALGYSPLVANLDIFVCGLSLNLLPKWRPIASRMRALLSASLVVSVPIFYVVICVLTQERAAFHMQLNDFWARCPWIAVVYAAGFIWIAEARGKIAVSKSVFGWMLFLIQWLGTLTYCLYVFHSAIFLTLATLVPRVHGLRVDFKELPLAAAETLAVAAGFYYFVEKPFDKKKRVGTSGLMDAP